MLVIEKVVKLLDDFHYEIFIDYVRNHSKRSFYPEILVNNIKRDLEIEQNSDDLCDAVYMEKDEKTKKKFFQLAHHTFKLTSFLAKNYPNYLRHNISLIQHFINKGQLNKANKLIEIVLEISQKIADYPTELEVLQILSQQHTLLESYDKALKYQGRILELLSYQRTINELISYFYTHLNPKSKASKEDIKHADYFQQFHGHPSSIVHLISTYYYCFTFYYLRSSQFYSPKMFKTLLKLESDLIKNNYIVFPYMIDCLRGVGFLKLHYLINEFGVGKVIAESNQLITNSEENLYWNSFVNFTEIFALAVQASYYAGLYMKNYREDYYQQLPTDVKLELNNLKRKCQSLLNNELLREKFTMRYINLSTIYALYLLCGTPKDLQKAIDVLENLLLSYQQVPFHAYIDSIYSILIIAHFCFKNFDKVDEHYKRYRRSTKGKVVNPENDLSLHGFYYASKWLETSRKQYAKKLSAILEATNQPNLKSTQAILIDVIEYFEISVEIPEKQK